MKKKTNVAEARNKIKQMFQAEMIKELKNLYIRMTTTALKPLASIEYVIKNKLDYSLLLKKIGSLLLNSLLLEMLWRL